MFSIQELALPVTYTGFWGRNKVTTFKQLQLFVKFLVILSIM
jgi:hypothetical protein